MTRRASALLAGVVLTGLSGIGAAIFSSVGATANPFSGPFGSSGGGSSVVRTGEDFVRVGLGEDVSYEHVTITGTSSSADALTILSGRIRMAPSTVSSGAIFYFDPSIGFVLNGQLNIAPGGPVFADYLLPRQNSLPVTVGDSDGTVFACQSSPGTCDAAHKGAVLCVNESATSATRLCRCILTASGGDYRWLNMDTATRGSTTTDCPDTAP